MRQRLELWLNHIWYGGSKPPAWLRALIPIYRFGCLIDKKIQLALSPASLVGRTVLVVGNITAGGSGKTPLVIRLCGILQEAGLRPGVISRGYGRRRRDLIRVTPQSTAAEVGDEPLVILRRSGVPVIVAADRCSAATAHFADGIDVVIADDGLQHHKLPRCLEICVIDGEREFGNGLLLPAGPLREPLNRLQAVDYVVVNGSEQLTTGGDAVRMHLIPSLLRALVGDETWRLSQFKGCRVSAIAGIANPTRFFRTLEHAGLHVSEHIFPDHHVYISEDFSDLEPGLPIIMTEKDAVKCQSLELANAWYLAIEASLPAVWESAVVEKIKISLANDMDNT